MKTDFTTWENLEPVLRLLGVPLALGQALAPQLGVWLQGTIDQVWEDHNFRLNVIQTEITDLKPNHTPPSTGKYIRLSAQELANLGHDEWDDVLLEIRNHRVPLRTLVELERIWTGNEYSPQPGPFENSGEVLWIAVRGNRAALVVVSKEACRPGGGFKRPGILDCRPVTKGMLLGWNPPLPALKHAPINGLDLSCVDHGLEDETQFHSLFPIDEWHPINHPIIGWKFFLVGAQRVNDLYLWTGEHDGA